MHRVWNFWRVFYASVESLGYSPCCFSSIRFCQIRNSLRIVCKKFREVGKRGNGQNGGKGFVMKIGGFCIPSQLVLVSLRVMGLLEKWDRIVRNGEIMIWSMDMTIFSC